MKTILTPRKPANFDNSWLGIMGEGAAFLMNAKGQIIGTCLDTPNNVTAACILNKAVKKAKGILGFYNMKEIETRKNGIDMVYHKRFIKFN